MEKFCEFTLAPRQLTMYNKGIKIKNNKRLYRSIIRLDVSTNYPNSCL